MSRENGRKWDGRSRVPTQLYKDNYNNIFGKKVKKKKDDELNHKKNDSEAKNVVR